MRAGENGYPELDVGEPIVLPDLPEHPTMGDLARAYAQVVITYQHEHFQKWTKVVQAIQWLTGAVMGAKGAAEAAAIDVRYLRALLATGSVPPMRAESPSSMELARDVAKEVAAEFEAKNRDPSTPPVAAHDIAAMVEGRVKQELQRIKNEEIEKREKAREEAEKEAKKESDKLRVARRRLVYTAVGGIIAVLTTAALALIDHFAR